MKFRLEIVVVPLILIVSCAEHENSSNADSLWNPDTAAFIQSWKMTESVMLNDLYATDTSFNQLGLDTIVLTHTPLEGPDWYDESKPKDCKECREFYIEAADSSLKFPKEFAYHGNQVKFYGVLIPGLGLPSDREFVLTNPEPANVLRYYGYEVIRPYKLMGYDLKSYNESGLKYAFTVTIR